MYNESKEIREAIVGGERALYFGHVCMIYGRKD